MRVFYYAWMVDDRSLIQATLARYHGDDAFRRFVDGILARILVEHGTALPIENMLGQATPMGVPAAELVNRMYAAQTP